MNKETLTVERDEEGTVTYSNFKGYLHNPYGPAVVGLDGHKEHWFNGQLHNPDGPAIVCANGGKWYFINGQRHNPNGLRLLVLMAINRIALMASFTNQMCLRLFARMAAKIISSKARN
jgi:hypothetical protein